MDKKPLMPSAIIVGAGPVGALLAIALDKLSWQVTLIEKQDKLDDQLPSSYDNRQLALTHGSIDWLTQSQMLPAISTQLTPILSIHTSSQDNMGCMTMTAAEMHVDALGYTISQQQLGQALFQQLDASSVTQVFGVTCHQLTQDEHHVSLHGYVENQAKCWQADYCFAADGVNSWVRSMLGINTQRTEYDHLLLTAVATLNVPHEHKAVERFTPQGPTALLPMQGTHQAKVVYCYRRDQQEAIEQQDTSHLIQKINDQLGLLLGKVAGVHDVKTYPLLEMRADHLLQGRCLLMGNAAHTQHPVAGQGLNLGIRDIEAVYRWAHNPDIGLLHALAIARQQDHKRTMRFTHGLAQIFTNPSSRMRRLAGLGIGVINAITPLKRTLSRMAMGY